MRYFVLSLALLFLVGCKGPANKIFEEVIEEVRPLESSGTVRIRNEDGVIHLFGSNISELQVKAIKRAYSTQRLQALKMRIVSEAGSTSIETVAPPKKKWALRDRSGTIDYIVIVPQTLKAVELELVDGEISINGLREGSARARVVNGRLSARNCFGDLSFQASNGSIDFYYDWWEERERTVEATVPNGMLGVFVPRSASFYLQAETRGGNVIGNLIDGDEAEHGHRKQVAMKIGSANGARFQLKSGNGNIHVHGY